MIKGLNRSIKTILKLKMPKVYEYTERDEFTLKYVKDNIFEPINQEHIKEIIYDGKNKPKANENPQNLRSVNSSVVFTFNTFGNLTCRLARNSYFPEGKYKIYYEKHFAYGFNKSVPVKLDVYLVSKCGKYGIAIESKMMEWISNLSAPLTENYLKKNKYDSKEIADIFIPFFKKILSSKPPKRNKKGLKMYKDKFTRIDALQIVRHIMGIYQSIDEIKESGIKNLTLMIVCWKIKEESSNVDLELYKQTIMQITETMKYEANILKDQIESYFKPYFIKKGINLNFVFQDFFQLNSYLLMEDKQREYYKRYIID